MAYPPSLAPSSRWIAIMDSLPDHFGEDASLEPELMSQIRAYLTINSAEKWDTRAAHELALANPERSASPDGDAVLGSDASADP